MKKLPLALLLAAALTITAACSASSTPNALPAGSDQFPTSTTGEAVKTDPVKVTTTTEAAPVASTCNVTREALLTGTQPEINASMKALVADKTADATAREYADTYLRELADDYSWAGGEAENLRRSSMESSATLIRMYCS